jgi:hypothetical protein
LRQQRRLAKPGAGDNRVSAAAGASNFSIRRARATADARREANRSAATPSVDDITVRGS